jgi:hypothetical protein
VKNRRIAGSTLEGASKWNASLGVSGTPLTIKYQFLVAKKLILSISLLTLLINYGTVVSV